jgi:hypothetical protein
MTKERELLIRALRYFQKTDCVNTLAEDIEHFLSTTSDDAEEPVAWIAENKALENFESIPAGIVRKGRSVDWFHPGQLKTGDYVYLRPLKPAEPTTRKPLTEEEIDKEIATNDDYWLTDLGCFSAGVRFAEKRHGITNESDS